MRVRMAREYVTSTSIVWFEFDVQTRMLEIEFISGGVYRYFGVPPTVADELRAADSKGRFVNEIIKPRYRCERVKAPRP
ncbi:MAG: hypothetical protein JWM87_4139 [Candidatus Eremiobacteraeota bacterium]|nr:hypothetical protein [Candidatus Eremiobacteraeota bacterium]